MTQIGDYKIVEKIGQGGMATVYKGLQVALNRPVAIKVMAREMVDHEEMVKRFDLESLIIARLQHPNIIGIIDKGMTEAGNAYFVMEYVDGTDLANLIRKERLSAGRKLEIALQVGKALSYAHKNGVIHRDIKPGNILIDAEHNVVVSDFGTAQLNAPDVTRAGLTQVGMVMGTLSYMSPEQREDSSTVTTASDIFSYGVVLYELFTGRKPVGKVAPPNELVPRLPGALSDLILQCLEHEPKARPSADDIRNRLLHLSKGQHLDKAQHDKAAREMANLADQFLLLDVIREDRHGSVYLYEHRRTRALMVVKRLPSGQAGLKESKVLQAKPQANIVRVLGTASNPRSYIILTQYLEGGSLHDRLLRPMPVSRALTVLKQICTALDYGHELGLIHGNLRPSNVLFDDKDRVRLADFGLEEHYRERHDGDNWYNVHCQQRSRETDILAAGTMMYQMLCAGLPEWGRDPNQGDGPFRRLPAGVRQLVAGMIEARPGRRYHTARAVLDDIERLVENPQREDIAAKLGRRGGWRRVLAWGLAAMLVIDVVAFAVWQLTHGKPAWAGIQQTVTRLIGG